MPEIVLSVPDLKVISSLFLLDIDILQRISHKLTKMCQHMHTRSASVLGVLLMWCLQLGFVHSAQPRLNVAEHDILKTLFDSTGGSEEKWNYAAMEGCLQSMIIYLKLNSPN